MLRESLSYKVPFVAIEITMRIKLVAIEPTTTDNVGSRRAWNKILGMIVS